MPDSTAVDAFMQAYKDGTIARYVQEWHEQHGTTPGSKLTRKQYRQLALDVIARVEEESKGDKTAI